MLMSLHNKANGAAKCTASENYEAQLSVFAKHCGLRSGQVVNSFDGHHGTMRHVVVHSRTFY